MLQTLGLPNPDFPLFIYVGRLAEQKGVDLLIDALWWHLPRDRLNAVILGQGEPRLHGRLAELAAAFGSAARFVDAFDPAISHRLMAAGDFLLMPSLFEPCGLTQMQAQRYGTVPIARRTGGLVDTIVDGATGFLFDAPTPPALQAAIWRAITLYRDTPEAIAAIARRGMAEDFSFAARVPEYLALYR
jgi:starch synthase